MRPRRTGRTPVPALAEAWWPLQDVAPTGSRWYADHVSAGWWDPADPHRTRLRHAAALVDELLASLPQAAIADGATLVELGCGPGTALQELAARWPGVLHAWEPQADAATVARTLAPDATIHDGALPLPLPDASADVVWIPRALARGTAEWAPLIAEAHRVLRPGGLLATVLAGPGAWAWHGPAGEAWDEDGTGLLVLGFDRPDAEGGPIRFASRWWVDEHWGRGFDPVSFRAAGVTMVHPGQGFGFGVRRRGSGDPLSADAFAAVAPEDRREGRAFHRQLALADAEARTTADRQTATIAAVRARAAALSGPDAVDEHPRVREALQAVASLEAEIAQDRRRADAGPVAAP